ncbi:hypothetical protein BKI52_34435 [marine bacterium AO1-C]|nr:hypothetical protein BKI52_34435 [marine bacterium AO1-C]
MCNTHITYKRWLGVLCLLGSTLLAQGQGDMRTKVGRIIDQATGKGVPNVRIIVRIPKTQSGIKTKQPFRIRTDKDGFYRIPIEVKFSDSDITIENIEGYEPVGPENALKEIAVRQVTSKSRSYELILEGKNNQKIRKAYFIFNRNSFPFELSGKFSFRTEAYILDLMPLEIEIRGMGKASGKFTVYKKGIGKDGKWLYWTREGKGDKQVIRFRLPITESPQRYQVRNSQGDVLKNYQLVLQHNGEKIYTDQNGYFSLQMHLEKSDISNPRDEVDRVDGKVIHMNTNLVIFEETKIDSVKLEKGLKDFQKGSQVLTQERDSLLKELAALKYETRISNDKIDYFEKKIQSFERKYLELINRFKKEVLAGLASNDINLTKQDTIVNLDQFREYLDYYRRAKATQDRVRQVQVYTIVSTIVGLLAIVGLLLWSRKLNKQKNKVLKAQKTLLEKQSIQLGDQVNQLNSQEHLIKLLLSEMKHRAGNDLISIQAKISMVRRQVEDEQAKEHLKEARDHIRKLIDIQESLSYSFSNRGEEGIINKSETELRLRNIANTLFNFHFDSKNYPNLTLLVEINDLVKSRFTLVSFCAFELINNACKYAIRRDKATTHSISIVLERAQGFLRLMVSNSGQGIEEELFENELFVFGRLSSFKGLNIVKKITELEKGDFKIYTTGVHTEITEGSRFECTYKYPLKL